MDTNSLLALAIILTPFGLLIWSLTSISKSKKIADEIITRYEPLIKNAYEKEEIRDLWHKFEKETIKDGMIKISYPQDVKRLRLVLKTKWDMIKKLEKNK